MHRLGWMFFLLTSVLWICLSTGKAEGEIKILPSPTGRNVIVDYGGIPERVRQFFPKYTNAYISVVDGIDYRQGIAILGDAKVTDDEMIRTRDIVNIVLLSDPRIREGLSELGTTIALVQKEPERYSELEKVLLSLRPIELIYTDYEGRNEVGLGDKPSVIPQKLMQLWTFYPVLNSSYLSEINLALENAYDFAYKNKIYRPEAKYLEPDFAHPGVRVAVGTYMSLAYEVYHSIVSDSDEYQIKNRAEMKVKDPLMYEFLGRICPDWFDYRTLLRDYISEIKRLRSRGKI